MPLALAMSVNVGFIIGLTFVPGLWNIVEYLFPRRDPRVPRHRLHRLP